jgi:orotidine-5'-phosphate decarboxylase
MRTSNKGMRDFEYLELNETVENATGQKFPRRLYDAVGDKLSELAEAHKGEHGFGAFGAVVGCTEQDEAAAIRAKRSNLFFLIPGYGAQGGAADDAALLLRECNGGVVNASRSILKAWTSAAEKAGKPPAEADNAYAAEAARKAAIEMRDAIRAAAEKAGASK